MKVTGREVIPPATADYTPFASKLMQNAPDWVYCWAPLVTEVKTFDSLRKLGWQGPYALNVLPETEIELAQIKDDKLFALGSNAMFFENLPVQTRRRAPGPASSRIRWRTAGLAGWRSKQP